MFKMREIHKIINTAVIFMILGCWVGQELAYSSDIFYLRVPMGIDKNRAAAILARDGGAEGMSEDPLVLEDKRKEREKIERAGVAIRSFRHGISDVFDIFKDAANIGSGFDLLPFGLDTHTQYLEQMIYEIRNRVVDVPIDVILEILQTGGNASKRGELTTSEANKCIADMQRLRDNLLTEKQELGKFREEFFSHYQGGESGRAKVTVEIDDLLIGIDKIADKLQSRLEIAAAISVRSFVGITNIVSDLCEGSRIIAVENNLTSAVAVRGNRLTFTSALLNILTNAVFFAKQKQKEAARVNVRLTEENGFVRIDIADNGPGIPADLLEIDPLMNRPKLFNLNVSQREGGTGLGTTEAWYAIKDAGGTIEVDSLTQDQIDKTRDVYRLANVRVIKAEPVMAILRSFAEEIDRHFSQMIEASDALIKAFEQGIEIDIQHFDMVRKNLSEKPFSEIFAGTKMEPEVETRLAGLFHSANMPGIYFNGIWTGIRIALTKKLPLDKKDKIEKLRTFRQNTEFWREIFRRISKGQRVEPGTTFTIRLPIAQDTHQFYTPEALLAGGGAGLPQGQTDSGGEHSGRKALMGILKEIPTEMSMGDAEQRFLNSPQFPEISHYLAEFDNLRKIFGGIIGVTSLIPLLVELRISPEELDARAQAVLADEQVSSLFGQLDYQFEYRPLFAQAVMASGENHKAVKDFLQKEGAREVLRRKRTGQAISIFLAARRTRAAARAFLSELLPEKVNGSVLTEESMSLSCFWYYMAPVFEELLRRGDSPQVAGRRLAQWAYNYHTLETQIDFSGLYGELNWEDWLNEDKYNLNEFIVKSLVTNIADVLWRLDIGFKQTESKLKSKAYLNIFSRDSL